MISYDSSQQLASNQLAPYDTSGTMYYLNSNEEEDEDFNTLNQGLALIARAFSKFSNKTNNRLRSSSNTRNQAVIQDGRVEIQHRNFGRSGSGGYSGNSGNGQRFNNNGGFRTTQVLIRKGLKLLKLGIQTLGMQCGATTVMEKVILLLLVLNQEQGEASFISKHYS